MDAEQKYTPGPWHYQEANARLTAAAPDLKIAREEAEADKARIRREGFREGVEAVRDWIRAESMPGISDDTALINRNKFEQAVTNLLNEHRGKNAPS
jgi:hypothetical protein